MPIKIHHRITPSGDAVHDTQDLARDITERLLSGVRVLDQSSLEQETCVQIVEIEINHSQPPVVEIIRWPSIISEVVWS
jgi:hypothetical protein